MKRRAGLWILTSLALAACERAQAPTPPPAGPPGRADRVILVGLDGAGWPLLDAAIAAGRMPWLAGLVDAGTSAVLWSEEPTVSPALWTTILTGRGPDAHGIRGFTGRARNGVDVVPSHSAMRRVPALWSWLEHYGRTAGIVGGHVTWPAEQVSGFLVSRRVSEPGFSHTTHPPELAARAGDGDLAAFDSLLVADGFLSPEAPDNRYDFMRETWRTDHVAFELGMQALGERAPDFLFVYFHVTDSAQHVFWPPKRAAEPSRAFEPILRVYEHVDRLLSGLAARVQGERTAIVVVSDHGAAGSGVAVLFERHTDELLAALGFVSFRGSGAAREIDRERSLLLPGPASGEMVRFWVNRAQPELAGRADLRARVAEEARARLGELRLERAGRPLFREVIRSPDDPDVLEAHLGFESLDDAGDTLRIGERSVPVSTFYRPAPFGGGHTLDGVLVAAGPPFRKATRLVPGGPAPRQRPADAPGIRDVVPTLLAALGLPVPTELDGRVLEEILDPTFLAEEPPRREDVTLDWRPFDPEGLEDEIAEPDEMLRMLEALGYAQ